MEVCEKAFYEAMHNPIVTDTEKNFLFFVTHLLNDACIALNGTIVGSNIRKVTWHWTSEPGKSPRTYLKDGIALIAMPYTFALAIHFIAQRIHAQPTVSIEALFTDSPDLPSPLGLFIRPDMLGEPFVQSKDRIRCEYADILAITAVQFIFLHEGYHLVNGHMTSPSLALMGQQMNKLSRQAIELDADINALSFMLDRMNAAKQLIGDEELSQDKVARHISGSNEQICRFMAEVVGLATCFPDPPTLDPALETRSHLPSSLRSIALYLLLAQIVHGDDAEAHSKFAVRSWAWSECTLGIATGLPIPDRLGPGGITAGLSHVHLIFDRRRALASQLERVPAMPLRSGPFE